MYDVHSTTNPYLEKVRSHKKPYIFEVLGKKIIINPNVMSPKYDWSSRFCIEQMPNQKGKSFLEVGSGCGVISVFAGLQEAQKVVALDINPNAVENTKNNFGKYNLTNAQALESDLFEKTHSTFDTIFFNAPYHGSEPQDMLERGVSDHNYEVLRRFLREAKKYLNKKGSIFLGFSNTGDTDLLNHLILENKYFLVEKKEETNEGWTAYLYELKPLLFVNHWLELFFKDNLYFFKQ
ncbi:MAG: Rossmann-like fold-containing protein, partial [Candidatus Paceibacterota bacterium]